MKKVFIILAAIAINIVSLHGQKIVTIGNDMTNTVEYPFTTYYEDGRTQILYTSDEISMPGLIEEIGFNVSENNSYTMNGFTIKMGLTTNSTLTSIYTNATEVVYQGEYSVTATGWQMIQLQTPFYYDGSSNLIIEICYDNEGWDYYSLVYASSISNMTMTDYDDDNNGCSMTSLYQESYRPNLRLLMDTSMCPRPYYLSTTDNSTGTSVDLSWISPYSATAWELKYNFGDFDPDLSGNSIFVTNTNYTLLGLSSNTSYTVYVRGICGTTDTSQWSRKCSFVTCQIPDSVPYYCGFENNIDNHNWTLLNNDLYSNNWIIGAATQNGGNNALYVSDDRGVTNHYSQNSCLIWAYRDIYFTPADGYEISFDWKSYGEYNDYLYFFIYEKQDVESSYNSVDPYDLPGFNNQLYNNREWQTFTGTLDGSYSGTTKRIYFLWSNNDLNSLQPPAAIDNISVTPLSCGIPFNLHAENITEQSADIFWTTTDTTDLQFQIVYGLSGFEPDSGGTYITVSTNEAQLTNLASLSDYDVYVRRICSISDTSQWSLVHSFTTLCDAITDFPFTESFEQSTYFNYCWKIINNNFDQDTWEIRSGSSHSGNYNISIYTDYNSGYNDDYLITPKITLSGNQFMQFYKKVRSSGEPNDYIVLLSTTGNNPEDFNTVLFSETASNTTYEEVEIDLRSYSGNVYIAFRIPPGGADGWYLYLDDVTIDSYPSCLKPTNLTADFVTTNQAYLGWTPSGTDTIWQIRWGLSNENPANMTLTSPITSNELYLLHGLNSASEYKFYVRAICGEADTSDWSDPITFITACDEFAPIPYQENFDYSGNYVTFPYCWTKYYSGTTSTYPYILYNNYYYSGNAALYFYSSSSYYTIASTPKFSTPLDSLLLTFQMYKTGSSNDIQVGVMSNPTNPATFELLGTISPTYTYNWQLFEFYLDRYNFSENAHYIAFKSDRIIYGQSNSAYIDNVKVTYLPTCYIPTNLRVNILAHDSAYVLWDAVNLSNQWTLEYKLIGDVSWTTISGIDTNYYLLTNLIPGNNYLYRLKSICGEGDETDWTANSNFYVPLNSTDFTYFSVHGQINPAVIDYQNHTISVDVYNGYLTNNMTPTFSLSPGAFAVTADSTLQESGVTSNSFLTPFTYYVVAENDVTFQEWIVTITESEDTVCLPPNDLYYSMHNPNWYNIHLFWGHPIGFDQTENVNDIASYNIYRDGVYIGSVGNHVTDHTDSVSGPGTYLYEVSTNWVNGCESERIATSVTMAEFPCDQYCNLIFKKYDSAGDGWNGAYIEISVDGWPSTYVSLENGAYEIDTVQVCLAELDFIWNWGGWGSECAFEIYDMGNNLIYNQMGAPSNQIFLTYNNTCVTCSKPLNLLASNITSTSVDVSWNAGGSETNWILEYKSESDLSWTSVNVQTNPFYQITNLQGNTNYMVRVKANCSESSQSTFTDIVEFLSLNCSASDQCDLYFYLGGRENNSWNIGGCSLSVYVDHILASTYTLPIGVFSNSYNLRVCDSSYIELVWNGYSYYDQACFFGVYDNSGNEICFVNNTNNISGNFYSFTFRCTDCPRPFELAAEDITSSSANLSWIYAGATNNFEIAVGSPGFNPDLTTPIATTSNPYHVTGLSPATEYEFIVRAVCGDNNKSIWSRYQNFTTRQIPATVPYVYGFEDAAENMNWQFFNNINPNYPNNWFIGYGTHNGGEKSLYISSNEGESNVFSEEAPCIVWAYRDIYFTPSSQYMVSFDWKCKGSGNDFANVYIADPIDMEAYTNNWGLATPAGAFVLLNDLYESDGWVNFRTTLDASFSGTTKRIYFVWINDDYDQNSSQPPIAIDNFRISNCVYPENLTVNNITPTSAQLSWTGFAENYRIELINFSTGDTSYINSVGNTYNLNDLTVYNGYMWRVQSLCGGPDTSEYSEYNIFYACPAFASERRIWYVSQQNGLAENYGTDVNHPADDVTDVLTCPCLQNGDTVLVATGNYIPSYLMEVDVERSKTFYIDKNIVMIGGYSNDFLTRDRNLYPTILNGDIGVSGTKTDNSYNVVFFNSNSTSESLLKGFTIRNGYANDLYYGGGGVYYGNLEECIIDSNYASNYGGGTYYTNLTDCILQNNTVEEYGGGSYYGVSDNCRYINNSSNYYGGAKYGGTSNYCEFIDNHSNSEGGAVSNGILHHCTLIGNSSYYGGGTSGGDSYHCKFNQNSANYGGGSYYSDLYNCLVTENSAQYGGGKYSSGAYNCTFVKNNATNSGGGNAYGNNYNCIFWGNTSSVDGPQYYNGSYEYCAFQGIVPSGTGNISLSLSNFGNEEGEYYVRFEDPNNGDYHLQYGSDCMNIGNNYYANNYGITTDIDSNNRIFENIIDLGVYEMTFSLTCLPVRDLRVTYVDTNNASVAWSGEGNHSYFRIRLKENNTSTYLVNEIVYDTTYTFTALDKFKLYDWSVKAYCSANDSSLFISGETFRACPAFDDYNHRIWYVSRNTGVEGSLGNQISTPAKDISDVLSCPCLQENDTILVANGEYFPSIQKNSGIARSETFYIDKNIKIIGGYNNDFLIRDIGLYPTILNGDIGTHGVKTDNAFHVVFVNNNYAPKALLKGFTIKNGYANGNNENTYGGGIYYGNLEECILDSNFAINYGGGSYYSNMINCTIMHNIAQSYGGGSYNGNHNHCDFIGNTGYYGGGLSEGNAHYCQFIENRSDYVGGGSYNSTLYNCLLNRNYANYGGGLYSGIAYNSTFVNNHATTQGGGCCYGTIYNSILWGNTSDNTNSQHYNGYIYYCAIEGTIPSGTGNLQLSKHNFGNDETIKYPRFEDPENGDYHLQYGSDCMDKGYNYYVTNNNITTDLDGNERIFNYFVDLGAYEMTYSLSCIPPHNLHLINIDTNFATVAWAGENNHQYYRVRLKESGTEDYLFNEIVNNDTITFTGLEKFKRYDWSVRGFCSNNDSSLFVSGESFMACPSFDDFNQRIWYVNQSRGIDGNYGTMLSAPAKDISDVLACPCLQDNDSILVSAGTYIPSTQLTPGSPGTETFYIDKNISLIGGYSDDYQTRDVDLFPTILSGDIGIWGDNSDNSFHVVYVNNLTAPNAFIKGFEIKKGNANGSSTKSYGGGAFYGNLDECIIDSNYASQYGGGTYYSNLINCNIHHNGCSNSGGGAYEGNANNCIFFDNSSSYIGGGKYYGTTYNSTFSQNHAQYGGAASGGTIYHSIFKDNGAYYGGATYDATCYYSIFYNNSTSNYGGGAYYGNSNSCLFINNSADYGGGAYYGTSRSCTFSNNYASTNGGGTYYGSVYNSILWGNRTASGDNQYYSGSIYYSAIQGTLVSGSGNIQLSADNYGNEEGIYYVRFEDPVNENYRLQYGSSCINRGYNYYVTNNNILFDLDSNTRIKETTVDMGAYESYYSSLTCPPANNLHINEINLYSATVAWHGNSETYRLRYKKSGTQNYSYFVISDTTYTFTNLDPITQYDWSVQALCNYGGDSSVFVSGESFLTCPSFNQENRTWYVSQSNGLESNYGESVASPALNLSTVLNCPCLQENDTILIANGTYTPDYQTDTNDNRTHTYYIDKKIVIKGGYSNDFLSQDLTTYPTILSGEQGIQYDISDNSYHVFYFAGSGSSAMVDNCIITEGNANGGVTSTQYGGGSYGGNFLNCIFYGNNALNGGAAYNSSMKNCDIYSNTAVNNGGGIFADLAGITISDCSITNNQVVGENYPYGGGIYANKITVTNCTITNNYCAGNGGGVYSIGSSSTSVIFKFCNISHNYSKNRGGGIYADYYSIYNNCYITNNRTTDYDAQGGGVYSYGTSTPNRFTNCNITDNNSTGTSSLGGGVFTYRSTFTNCDIVNNSSIGDGGGVYNYYSYNTFLNTIIWGNKQGYFANNISPVTGTYSYCAVEGVVISGTGNITLAGQNDGNDPSMFYVRFMNPSNQEYQIHSSSICVDNGDPSFVPTDTIDIEGNYRIRGNAVDIGSYESEFSLTCPSPTNLIVSDITTTTALLTFNKGSDETQWYVVYYPVNSPSSQISQTISDTSFLLTGLDSYNDYTAKIRAICDSDMSVYSIPVFFSTNCDTSSLGWSVEFTNLSPENNTIIYSSPVTLSWPNIPEASYYNIYVWESTASMPSTPTTSGLTSTAYNYSVNISSANYGKIYYWKVVAHQDCIELESDTMIFKIKDLADIHVTQITNSTAQAGRTMTVQWTVKNDGMGATPPGATWQDHIWIVSTVDVRLYDNNDHLVATVENLSSLNPGETYINSVDITVPEELIGNFYLFVFSDQIDAYSIDFSQTGGIAPVPYEPSVTGNPYYYFSGGVHHGGVIPETSENDNFFYKLLNILPPPSADLIVSNISHPTSIYSGNPLSVTWTVKNDGDAATVSSQWQDVVYISQESSLNLASATHLGTFTHQGHLAIDSTYTTTQNVTIPNTFMGTYYIFVRTDLTDNVYESIFEVNNTTLSAYTLNVILTPPSDLAVLSIAAPSTVSANDTCTIHFRVKNIGLLNTEVSRWVDGIYISQSETFTPASATLLKSIQHNGTLMIDSFYDVSSIVTIPNNIEGEWYFYIKTDKDNQVFEYLYEENNVLKSSTNTTILIPDLSVSNMTIQNPIDPNEPLTIYWTIKNNGPGSLINRTTNDAIYLNSAFSRNISSNLNLAPGATELRSITLNLPCYTSSTISIMVSTDYQNTINENNETNNSSTQTIQVRTPDLSISNLVIDSATWSGDSMNISWIVSNSGSAAVLNQVIFDNIYLGNSPSFTPGDLTLIGQNQRIESLVPGESETIGYTAQIPDGIYGTYYVFVVIDATDSICEGINSHSNLAISSPLQISLSPAPDLFITASNIDDTIHIGSSSILSYTVTNQGFANISDRTWKDKIYISQLAYFNIANATLIGTIQHNRSLDTNSFFGQTTSIAIPTNIYAGNYYLYIVTDATSDIYEYTGENNNIHRTHRIVLKEYILDLEVSNIAGNTIVEWGQRVQYNMTVQNITNNPTLISSWSDALYLSSDTILDNNDTRLSLMNHSGVLTAYNSYQCTFNITIPFGSPSTCYLLGINDLYQSNLDINFDNNIIILPITVNSLPTPDLQIDNFTIIDPCIAGQGCRISYRVTNISEVFTTSTSWNDKVFLSSDTTLSGSDIELKNNLKHLTLGSGQSYTDTVSITIPLPNNGYLFLLAKTNANSSFFEIYQSNNIAHASVHVTLPLPGDLIIENISSENTILSGNQLHISWDVKNIGSNALSGRGLRELAYMSSDTIFDIHDKLLGSVTNAIILAPSALITHTLSARISGVREGEYYILIKTDVTNAFNEIDENNNTSSGIYPFNVTIRNLPFNTPLPDTLINDLANDYKLIVGENSNETVRLYLLSSDSASGAVNNFYVLHNDIGSNLQYDYSSIEQLSANPEIFIPSTQSDYYGINVLGSTPAHNSQNIVLQADILPFELRTINPGYGGNTGVVTVELTGSRFREDMPVWLENENDTIYADTLIFVNYYQAFAQFDLAGKDIGTYTVGALNLCEGASYLEDAFEIQNEVPEGLATNLIFPNNPRLNRTISLVLEFGNIGNVDIYSPVISLVSHGGSWIAFTTDEISEHATTLQIPLQIEGDPIGVLRPGSYGTLTIFAYTSGQLVFTIKRVQ